MIPNPDSSKAKHILLIGTEERMSAHRVLICTRNLNNSNDGKTVTHALLHFYDFFLVLHSLS